MLAHFQIPCGPERSIWCLKCMFSSDIQNEEFTASIIHLLVHVCDQNKLKSEKPKTPLLQGTRLKVTFMWESCINKRGCVFVVGPDLRFSSGQLQHAVLGQDSLSLRVHERQGADDDVQDGRGLRLALHAHQPQEVLSVRESEEDQLCGLTEQPGVVGSQRHLVGISSGRRPRDTRVKRTFDPEKLQG